jgi:hypothetical protein
VTKLPRATLLFCDDVRQEIGGKFSAHGIYQAYIGIAGPSITVSKLMLFAEAQLPLDAAGGKVCITIRGNGKELFKVDVSLPAAAPVQPEGVDPQLPVVIPVEMTPFELKAGTRLFASMEWDSWSQEVEIPVVHVSSPSL